MDLVLQICDDYFLDRVWANLIPLTAFTVSPGLTCSLNNTSPVLASFPERVPANSSISLHADKFATLWAQTVASQPSISQMSAWPRDYLPRQLISLLAVTLIGIHIVYFLFAGLSYKFIFNHEMMRHPRFLKNQVRREIRASMQSFPLMIILTLPWFEAEVLGYSRLYDGWDTYGYIYLILSVPLWVSCAYRSSRIYSRYQGSSCLLTIISTGFIVGFIFQQSIRPSTSPITNGLVSWPVLNVPD